MDRELVQYLDGRFNDVNERIRHNGVLVEGLRDQVHLLAEGLATHIEAENVRHQAIQEQFRETRALSLIGARECKITVGLSQGRSVSPEPSACSRNRCRRWWAGRT